MAEFIEIIKVIVLGIVQGITEWLPISSTGHMILVEEFIKLNFSVDFMSMFRVVIQFGSILAVIVLFFDKLNPFSSKKSKEQKIDTVNLWFKVLIAVIPAGIIGLLFEDKIDALFYNSTTVAIMLILYGVLFIIFENKNKRFTISDFKVLSYKTAFFIGVFQVLSLIPGTSRSGATILGAIFLGCSRFIAAEFSFFLAIPVMLGASGLKIIKFGFDFSPLELTALITGMLVAFLVSIVAIKFLMDYIKKHDFKAFGYYRIILGIAIILYFLIK